MLHRPLAPNPSTTPTRVPPTDTSGPSRPRRIRRLVAGLAVALGALTIGAGTSAAQDVPEVPVAPPEVRPIAECVIVNGDGSFTAFFGYSNDTGGDLRIPKSYDNRIEPWSRPPTSFSSGRVVAAFSVTTYDRVITWYLGGQQAAVTPESTPCSTSPTVSEAPLALLLMLAPAGLTAWWIHRRRGHQPLSPC